MTLLSASGTEEQITPVCNPATLNNVALIVVAWGDQYINHLLEFALPALLAPGNFPSLAEAFQCRLIIATEQRFYSAIKQSTIVRSLEYFSGPCRLIPIDDLLIGSGSYGFTLTMALFRSMQSFGQTMTDMCFLFLNSDFIVANDSYKTLVPLISAGAEIICSPSYCTVEKRVLPVLQSHRAETAALSISKRGMAEIILGNLHRSVRGQKINGSFHFDSVYLYQAYIQPNSETLLGYQMPICVVALRPKIEVDQIATFWDWGVVSELCPNGNEHILS